MMRPLFMITIGALLISPVPLVAQVRASEMGTVSQVIDGTKITIEYSRPRARGRDPIFGTKAVTWGETWTPGANWATTLDVSRNVKLNGRSVPRGKYSVWMVVRQTGDWTIVLDSTVRMFHEDHPDSSSRQIRFPARVETAPFTDVLSFSFPSVRMNGATLVMQWERKRVPIDIEVEPSLVSTFPASEASLYVGEYTFTDAPDSAGKTGKVSKFIITHENGTLKARWDPNDNYMDTFAMIRIAPEMFTAGIYDKSGQMYEVLKPDMAFEFKRVSGDVTLTLRDEDDNLWGSAIRKR